MKFTHAIAALALVTAAPAFAESLTIDQVVELSKLGIGDDAIVAKIRSSGTRIDLSTDDMIALKTKGVSGPVIAALLSGGGADGGVVLSSDSPDPLIPHSPGVYMLADGKMERIDATVSSQAKTGGIFGYIMTSGIASMSIKAAIQNETARTKSHVPQPAFYFFFDASNPETAKISSSWMTGAVANATSPNEFTLVRLMQKAGRREARVGSMNIGGAKTGVMDQDRIPFTFDEVRRGVYRVTPGGPLKAGQYGFISSVSGGSAGAMTARIFDFSVE